MIKQNTAPGFIVSRSLLLSLGSTRKEQNISVCIGGIDEYIQLYSECGQEKKQNLLVERKA